jgi:ribosomal protein L9
MRGASLRLLSSGGRCSARKSRGVNVIMLREVPDVGLPGDVVAVRPGRARNHLVPRGMAAYATAENLQQHKDIVDKSQYRYNTMRENEAQLLAELQGEITQLKKTFYPRYRDALIHYVNKIRTKRNK